MTFTTPAAFNDYDPDADRLHGPPNDRETYHSPSGAVLLVMDYEREEFERDTHLELDCDVLDARHWQRLIRWLIRNIGLFDITQNLEYRRNQRVPAEPDFQI